MAKFLSFKTKNFQGIFKEKVEMLQKMKKVLRLKMVMEMEL